MSLIVWVFALGIVRNAFATFWTLSATLKLGWLTIDETDISFRYYTLDFRVLQAEHAFETRAESCGRRREGSTASQSKWGS